MANLSFTTQGATPFATNFSSTSQSSTPATNGGPSLLQTLGAGNSAIGGKQIFTPTPTPAANALNVAQNPTTPVKKTTTNNVDGSSTSTEYHAPVAPTLYDPTNANQLRPGETPQQYLARTQSGSGAPTNTGANAENPPQGVTYPGLLSSLAGTAQNGSANANTATSGLLGSADKNQKIVDQLKGIGESTNKAIADTSNYGNGLASGELTTGTAPVGQGNAAITQQTTAAKIAGLKTAEDAAIAPVQQELAAQAQAQSGLTSAGSLANTGQSNIQSGLTSALGAAKPEASFPFVFNPATGTFSAPGTGGAASTSGAPSLTYNPQTDAQNLAKAVMSRQIGYSDAVSALSYGSNGANAAGQLSAAVLAAGGNPTDLQAQAAGQASVAGSIPQLQAANTAAKGIQSTITNFLQSNPDINPANLALSNSVQQWIQGKQITDPRYQTLMNDLSEYTNTLAPILGVGGDATNLKTEIAQGFLNPKASAESITSVLGNISQLADDKVQNIQSGARGGGEVAGGTSPGTSGGGTFAGAAWK